MNYELSITNYELLTNSFVICNFKFLIESVCNFKFAINSCLGAQAVRLQDCTRESQKIWGFNCGRNTIIKNDSQNGFKRELLGAWKGLFKLVEFDQFEIKRGLI